MDLMTLIVHVPRANCWVLLVLSAISSTGFAVIQLLVHIILLVKIISKAQRVAPASYDFLMQL